MIEVGLTGCIGSGKSTVGRGLVARGAVLVDADAIVVELQQPGQEVMAQMVRRFGETILRSDGRLDRAALGRRVFADPGELAALNAIVHPAVRAEMDARRQALAAAEKADDSSDGGGDRGSGGDGGDRDDPRSRDDAGGGASDGGETVVVLDIPLLAESGPERRQGLDGIIVVDVDPEVAVARLVADRGLAAEDVRARLARQAGRAERLAIADFVIDNNGTPQQLESELTRCWRWIATLPR